VGGKNLIRMSDLQTCFEEQGFDDVATYIQSGNVSFDAGRTSAAALTERVERMLSTTFGYEASVAIRSRSQMRAIVEDAPDGFGAEPDRFRYDVIFLMPPFTSHTAMPLVPTREGVDRAWPGNGVLYFSRLTSRATQSRLSKVVSLPIYQRMTIRNWNTTVKLRELVDAPRAGR
jgi:uncharacterized protein (DUF1697 family)